MNTIEYIKHLEYITKTQEKTIKSLFNLLESKLEDNNSQILKIVHKK